jgi:hypothetical protein
MHHAIIVVVHTIKQFLSDSGITNYNVHHIEMRMIRATPDRGADDDIPENPE